jgi:hypothetical protein
MEIFFKTKLTQDKSEEILIAGEWRIARVARASVDIILRLQPPALPRAGEQKLFPQY